MSQAYDQSGDSQNDYCPSSFSIGSRGSNLAGKSYEQVADLLIGKKFVVARSANSPLKMQISDPKNNRVVSLNELSLEANSPHIEMKPVHLEQSLFDLEVRIYDSDRREQILGLDNSLFTVAPVSDRARESLVKPRVLLRSNDTALQVTGLLLNELYEFDKPADANLVPANDSSPQSPLVAYAMPSEERSEVGREFDEVTEENEEGLVKAIG